MSEVNQGRWAARLDGDFVVFIIGTRVDWRHPIRWFRDVGGIMGMPYMLSELEKHPEHGLLGYQSFGLANVQYWRSFEDLERWAADPVLPHKPALQKYWKRVGRSPRSGIWHETFLVRDGEYEAIYGNMPPRGLGKAAELVPLAQDSTAGGRLRRRIADRP
ncbi:MAG: DUF4188 domain-containing protein [Marmoricola sp.]|nr:DUF4188 domain-containing protein [Marmoricola sp.]